METTVRELEERVEAGCKAPRLTYVNFTGLPERHSRHLTEMYKVATEEEKLALTVDIYTQLRKGDEAEVRAMLGTPEPELDYDGLGSKKISLADTLTRYSKRTMATLNEGETQFRVWHGFPASFSRSYVDSCGDGLKLHVSGDKENVAKYVEVFYGAPSYPKATLPNGSRVIAYCKGR